LSLDTYVAGSLVERLDECTEHVKESPPLGLRA
jgi:hypothetical protein